MTLRFLTNVSAPLPYGADSKPHGLSNEAIITIVVFIFIALCILFSAIYLLIKGKNISEILEETLEDEACGNCIGIMNESVRTDDGIPDEVTHYLYLSLKISYSIIKELKSQIFIRKLNANSKSGVTWSHKVDRKH